MTGWVNAVLGLGVNLSASAMRDLRTSGLMNLADVRGTSRLDRSLVFG